MNIKIFTKATALDAIISRGVKRVKYATFASKYMTITIPRPKNIDKGKTLFKIKKKVNIASN